jgi:hypothetical protein
MSLKKILAALIPLCLCLGAGAQMSAAALEKAGLSKEEAAKVEAVYAKLRPELAKSQADLKVAEAAAERLLIEAQPDMAQLEKTLRQGYEIQLKMRLARIRAEVEIRGLVGEKKWLALRKLIRAAEDKSAASAAAAAQRKAQVQKRLDAQKKQAKKGKAAGKGAGESQ